MNKQQYIKDHASQLLPWLTARRPDGKLYTYKEILVNCSMPSDDNMQAALSDLAIANNLRRSQRKSSKENLLSQPEVLSTPDQPIIGQIPFPQEIVMTREAFLAASMAACNAFADVIFK